MADNETRVVYKAIGDFASLARSLSTARRNLAALRKEQAAFNAESLAGSAAGAAATDKSTKARKAENAAAGEAVTVYDRVTAAMNRATAARQAHAQKAKEAAAADRDAAAATEGIAAAATRVENALGRAARAFDKASTSQRRYEQQNKRTAASQNTVINGAQRVLGSFQKLGSFKPDIVPPFIALIPAIAGIIALIGPLASGLGAAGAAAGGFASSIGSLAGAALGVAPALSGLLSLVGALKVAFGGVGNVFKKYSAMQNAGGGGGGGGGTADKQAEISKTEKIARANETLRRSIQDVQFAEDDLNESRKDYISRLTELQKAVDRAAASQARASANERLAQENYANVLADPGSTKGQKMDAAASITEAKEASQDARAEAKKNAADLTEMQRKGINGDRQVIASQRAVTDAINANRDAEIALINAHKDTATAAGGGAAAANAYQDALDKLSPSARSVVLQLIGMKDAWDAMQRTVQESFFSQIVGDIQSLRKLFPPVTVLLSEFAKQAGIVASNFIKMVTGDDWLKDIETFGREGAPAVKDIGDLLMYAADGFRNITIGALPFARAIIKDLTGISRKFRDLTDTARKNGSMAAYLQRVQGRLEQWGRIVTNIGKTLINYGSAMSDFGQWLTNGFEGVTEGWVKSSQEARKQGSPFRKFLEQIKPLLKNLNGLLGDFFGWLGKTISDPKFIKQMNDITTLMRTKLGPAIGDIIKVLGETGVGTALVDTISEIAKTISTILDNGGAEGFKTFFDILQQIVKLIGDAASLPGGGAVISGIVTSLATLAAITFVGKFTGLFTLFGWLLKLSKSNAVSKLLDRIGGLRNLRVGGRGGGRGGGSTGGGATGGGAAAAGRSAAGRGAGGGATTFLQSGGSSGARGLGPGRPTVVGPGVGPQVATRGGGLLGRGAPNISSLGREAGPITKALGGVSKVFGAAGKFLGKGFGPGAILSIGGTLAGAAISDNAAKGKSGATQRVGGSILGGASSGAGIGATVGGAIGSVVPGVGTAIGAGAGAAVGGAIGGATSFFKASDEDKKAFLDDVKSFFTEDVPNFLTSLGSSIWDGLTTFGGWLADTWEVAKEFFANLPETIAYSIGYMWGMVQNLGDWLAEKWVNAKAWVAGLPKRIGDAAADVWRFIKGLPKWLGEQWENAKAWVAGLPQRIANTAKNIWANLKGFATWLSEKWTSAKTWVAGLPKRIGDAAGDIWANLGSIGGWLAKQGGKVKTWAEGLAGNIGNWVGDLAGAATRGNKDARRGKGRNNGGPIKRSGGGTVPGHGNSDMVDASLTPGEYVLRKAIAGRIGEDDLNRLNSGVLTYAQLLQRAMQSGKEGKATAAYTGSGPSFLDGGGLIPGGGGGTPTFGGGVGTPPPSAPSSSGGSGGSGSGGGLTLGTINIYNPISEKSSDSIPKAIRRTTSLGSLRRDTSND